jgi:hypothetical protein
MAFNNQYSVIKFLNVMYMLIFLLTSWFSWWKFPVFAFGFVCLFCYSSVTLYVNGGSRKGILNVWEWGIGGGKVMGS